MEPGLAKGDLWETSDYIEAFGSAQLIGENLSSADFRRNEPYGMHFTFAEAIDTAPHRAD